jgi:hypothetical protein
MEITGSGYEPVVASCEHSNTNSGGFVEHMR